MTFVEVLYFARHNIIATACPFNIRDGQPLLRIGDKGDPDNYRGVTLLSVVGSLL